MEDDNSAYIVLDDKEQSDDVEAHRSFLERFRGLNRNVKFILVIVAFAGLSESMGFGAALSAYLYLSTGKSNIRIGFLESCLGLTKLLTALPMGDIADKYGREPVSKVGSFAYVAATTVTVYAILQRASLHTDGADSQSLFIFWAVALCLWGFGKGVVDGPVLALFADSVPTGDRSLFYYYLYVAFWFGALAGPTAAIIIFSSQKNDWTFTELATVICVALMFKLFNAVLLCFLRDKDKLGEEADHVQAAPGKNKNKITSSNASKKSSSFSLLEEESDFLEDSSTLLTTTSFHASSSASDDTFSDDGSSDGGYSSVGSDYNKSKDLLKDRSGLKGADGLLEDDLTQTSQQTSQERRNAMIPKLVFAGSLVTQLGAGMTVKYYPLFFMEDVGMSPAAVQGVYLGVPLAMLVCGSLATKLSASGFGRAQTIVLFKTIGVASLVLFIIMQKFKDYPGVNQTVLSLLYVPPFLAATAFTDSTFPLEESILMDFVPAERRGRWKSLESVSGFGWCGSAVIGGYLADKYDYSFTFSITAFIQALAIFIWFALISLVPKEEGRAGEEDTDNQEINEKVVVGGTSGDKDHTFKTGMNETLYTPPKLNHSHEEEESEYNPMIMDAYDTQEGTKVLGRQVGQQVVGTVGRSSTTTSPLTSF